MATTATSWHRKRSCGQADVAVTVTPVAVVVVVVVVVVVIVFGTASTSRMTRCHSCRTWRMGLLCRQACDLPPVQLQPFLVLEGAQQQLQFTAAGRGGDMGRCM